MKIKPREEGRGHWTLGVPRASIYIWDCFFLEVGVICKNYRIIFSEQLKFVLVLQVLFLFLPYTMMGEVP